MLQVGKFYVFNGQSLILATGPDYGIIVSNGLRLDDIADWEITSKPMTARRAATRFPQYDFMWLAHLRDTAEKEG